MEKKKMENISPWIEFFCNIQDNQFFCAIEKDFIEDEFNLIGLNFQFSDLDKFLGVILSNSFFKKKTKFTFSNEVLELLYGLLHSRYIFTFSGIYKIFKKFSLGVFGNCSGLNCVNSNLLPFSPSDIPNRNLLKFFCPNCKNLFKSSYQGCSRIDGSFFGSSFLFFFLSAYPECIGVENFSQFVPRNFGFRFSEFYNHRNKPPRKIKNFSFRKRLVLEIDATRIHAEEISWYKHGSELIVVSNTQKSKLGRNRAYLHNGLF